MGKSEREERMDIIRLHRSAKTNGSMAVLPNTVVTSHRWLFNFKVINIKYNKKCSYLVEAAMFQVLNLWLVAAKMDSTVIEHFQ